MQNKSQLRLIYDLRFNKVYNYEQNFRKINVWRIRKSIKYTKINNNVKYELIQ